MAYSSTVTKGWPNKKNGIMIITIDVVINDGVEDVLTFSETAKYNEDIDSIGDVLGSFQEKLIAKCDKYLAEKAIYDATAFDNMVSTLETQLDNYLNS